MDEIDTTEHAAVPRLPIPNRKNVAGSQSRIPAFWFWLLGAALLLRIATAFAGRATPEQGAGLVHWQPHESAAAAAQTARKPVLYDFTATWCGPCHRLDSEGWMDSSVAASVNAGFLPARVVDRLREDGKNPSSIDELQRRYSVEAFPTLVVTDASGREIARMEGYGGKERLVQFLQDARSKAR